MDIQYASLETCAAVGGAVVVIDVWRSFTTAAFAFAAGVRDIVPVGSVEQAMALRGRFPGALLMGMGELDGTPAEGFDYGNSPAALVKEDLRDRRVIQCTPNGTRGIVRSANAKTLLAGSFVCAGATVRYLKQRTPARVTFVATEDSGEDRACAEYMAALLRDETPDAAAVLGPIRDRALPGFRTYVSHGVRARAQLAALEADLECCLSLDRFDLALVVQQRDGVMVMEAVT